MSKLDKIPYTPLLHLLALLTTFAVVVSDFVITFRNMHVNQENWDKFHDFLPFLYLWAAGQFLSKRATAWKPDANAMTATSEIAIGEPSVVTRSEVTKRASAGQPATPAPVTERAGEENAATNAATLGHPTREG